MPLERTQLARMSTNASITSILILLTGSLCSGCANPGPPKPPSLHLPAIVTDLRAERSADHVLLRWTTPSRTTDDLEVKGTITAELCRETSAPRGTAAGAASCTPVRRLTVTPGPSQVVDTLPPAMQSDPVALLTYRLRIVNATGHSAGESAGAYAAAGTAPAAVASLRATASERGAIVEWRRAPSVQPATRDPVELDRLDLSAPPAEKKQSAPALLRPSGSHHPLKAAKSDVPLPNEVHLREADAQAGPHGEVEGTVDTTATIGTTCSYRAERIRSVTAGGRVLQIHSGPSTPVILRMTDTFPPQTPTGLAAISGSTLPQTPVTGSAIEAKPYIDLSWEPNGEPDLAGYRVYRQVAAPDGSPLGPPARLTASPIAAPAYRDVAVKPGQGYIYSVTAVDAAGNESAPSANATEVVESPH